MHLAYLALGGGCPKFGLGSAVAKKKQIKTCVDSKQIVTQIVQIMCCERIDGPTNAAQARGRTNSNGNFRNGSRIRRSET